MAEHQDRITAALRQVRSRLRDGVPVPAGAAVRRRADRRVRVRRTSAAVLAAGAVAALAIGGTQLLSVTSTTPPPPAATHSPTPEPTASSPPTLPPLPEVTPSPRPAPLPLTEIDDPIAEVDWYHAAVTLPEHESCPSGAVQFAPFEPDSGYRSARVHADGNVIDIHPDDASVWAYGDVTGDDRVEVVLEVECFTSTDGTGLPSGHGLHFLAVARADDGALTGLGWLGPRGAAITSVWVTDGRVLMVGDPWTAAPEDHFPVVPGLALSYQWDGQQFAGWEPAADYPPIVPIDEQAERPVVRPRTVADGLECASDDVRFVEEPSGGLWTASGGDALYAIPARPFQQYLFDLDRTGDRLLVTTLDCVRADVTARGLAVFERSSDGWQGISVLRHPDGHQPDQWAYDGTVMTVEWSSADGEHAQTTEHRWDGTVFDPVAG